MRGVIYARYSSDNQREESIEGQIRENTAYAQKNGIDIVGTYIDRAYSAKTDNRSEFQRMIKDSAKKGFDVVIVWKLDRFSRNRYDSARYKAMLRKNDVKVVSATESISDGAEGIILESVLEGMAEYYSADLAEKVSRGMTENALKCRFSGGNIPFGYMISQSTFPHPMKLNIWQIVRTSNRPFHQIKKHPIFRMLFLYFLQLAPQGVEVGCFVAVTKADTNGTSRRRFERIVRKCRAMVAAAHADAGSCQAVGHRLRALVLHRKEQDRALLFGKIDVHALQGAQAVAQSTKERALVSPDDLTASLTHKADTLAKPGNGRGGECSAFQTLGELPWHMLLQREHPVAALNQRSQLRFVSQRENARSLDSAKPLVPGRAERVDAQHLHIDVGVTGRLRRVHRKEDAVPLAKCADLAQGQRERADIGGVRAYKKRGVGAELCFDIAVKIRNRSVLPQGFGGKNAVFDHARLGKRVDRAKHGVVLHIADEHVVALLDKALDEQIECVGGIEREDHVLGLVESQKLCRLLAAFVDLFGGAQGKAM